ncbi:MAG: PAS domain S-box protein [Kouleothrix sp.]|nr:PAS domain S-box protein [Kouleothrix sp.]
MIGDLLESLGALLEGAALGIVALDQAGRIALANRTLEAMFGYAPGELSGQPLELLLPEHQRAAHVAHHGAYRVAPQPSVMGHGRALHGRRKDGQLIPVEARLSRLAHDGQLIPVAFVTDITERKRAEAALQASEALNRGVLDSLTANIAVLDRNGTIIAVNDAWRRFERENSGPSQPHIGVGVSYLAACRAAADMGDDDARQTLAGIEAVLSGAAEQFTLEYPCHSPEAQRWFVMRATPLEDRRGVVVAHENITDRKQFEAGLHASEQRFRSYFELGLIGTAITSSTKGMLEVNDRCCAILGYEREELLLLSWAELTYPDDLAADVLQFNQALAGEIDGYEIDKRWVRKDGRVIDTTISVKCVRRVDGSVDYFVALLKDITDRKRAEAALRESEQRFRATFEQAAIGVALVAPSGSWLSVNQRLCKITGYTRDDLLGCTFQDLTHPDDLEINLANLREMLAGDLLTYTTEKRYVRRDGSLIWVNLTVSLVRDDEGAPSYFIAVVEDISERRQADQARARLAAIVDSSEDAIIGKALDGTILSWNAGAERIFGYTAVEAIGRTIELLIPADRQDEEASILARIRAGERVAHFESVRVRKDGQPIDVALTISPIRDADGRITGVSKIIRDITERKRADQALRRQTAFTHLLQTVAVAANQSKALEDALQIAVDAICMHIGWPVGHVYLAQEGRRHVLVSTDIWHLGEQHTIFRRITEALEFAASDDLPAQVLLSGKPEWVTDLATTSGSPRTKLISDIGVRAGFAFPVVVGAEVAAVLEFFSPDPSEPDRALLDVMAHVGAQLGRVVERARASEAMRASEERYRLIADNTTDLIHILDPESCFVYVSPSHKQVLGYEPHELIGVPSAALAHPDDRAAQDERWRGLVSTAGVGRATFRIRHADGSWRWIEESVATTQWQGANYLVGVARDISESRQAEQALREAEAKYRTLVEQIPAIIYTAEIDGTSSTRYVSPQIETILGFTPEEWMADPDLWLAQVVPDDRAGLLNAVNLLHTSTTPVSSEYRSLTRDGRVIWMQDAATIVRDDTGRPLFMQGISLDITERKQAEEALRESEAKYRTLARNFPNGAVMLFDSDLRYTIADGAGLADIGGDSREGIVGRTIWEIHPPELCAALEPRYLAALAGRPLIHEQSYNGHTYVFYILPVRAERGQVIAGMVMTQDITERKRIERALVEERALLAQRVAERTADLSSANAELARTARLKDEFLASMSHELRTPLNAVLGLSEALGEEAYGTLNGEQGRALRMIEESGRHLLELINDILDLAKIGAGKLELEVEPVEAAAICHASLRLIKQAAHKKRLTVESSIEPATAGLLADARRLKQVLVNLLSNAVKFTPEGGTIGLEVRGDEEQHRLSFTVWDTGIGIAAEHFERLFQPFVQLDSRLARQYEGTGLGLALVYRMVEMHGGSISVSSEVGAGSRFTVSLPWQDTHAPAGSGAAAPPLAAAAGAGAYGDRAAAPTILLAEDSEVNIAMIRDYLAKLGYQVIVARNGAEAIDRARESLPDLILMDVQMPGMDGLEAMRHIRADAGLAEIPIIALTALAMPGDRERCIAAGANDYLRKPIGLRSLVGTIESYLVRAEPSRGARP